MLSLMSFWALFLPENHQQLPPPPPDLPLPVGFQALLSRFRYKSLLHRQEDPVQDLCLLKIRKDQQVHLPPLQYNRLFPEHLRGFPLRVLRVFHVSEASFYRQIPGRGLLVR